MQYLNGKPWQEEEPMQTPQPGDVVRVSPKAEYTTRMWSADGYLVDYRDINGQEGFRVNWGDDDMPIVCDFPLATHQVTGFPQLHELRDLVTAGRLGFNEAVKRIVDDSDLQLTELGAREWLDGGES